MNIVGISGSIVGSKTRTAMNFALQTLRDQFPDAETSLLDLAAYDIAFSDGRPYLEYEGDTRKVAETIMEADAVIIGTPIFQASIPATLKNIFDLLPPDAFRDKVVAIVVTAGTPKHYLVAELQLKPILSYMKAHIVPAYVFAEEKDFAGKQLVNEEIKRRLRQLAEDTVRYAETLGNMKLDRSEI